MSKRQTPVQVPSFDPSSLDTKLDTISIEYNALWQHTIEHTYVARDLLRFFFFYC